MAADSAAIVTTALRRTYPARRGNPEVVALSGVDLRIERGEVRGLLGPNGAGKTTLCKILCTVLHPTSGSARVLGRDVVSEARAVQNALGIVFGGDRGLYGRLTARQNLEFWGALYGLHGAELRRRTGSLLERVGLSSRDRESVDGFSRGMKQRLHLARGLISDPQVLLLDEPTTGMDPVAALDFRALIGELRAEGRTILITTHDMSEAEAVCDQVTLIDQGAVLATERPAVLAERISRYEQVTAENVPDAVLRRIELLDGVLAVHRRPGGRVLVDIDGNGTVRQVLAVLVDAGVTSLGTVRPTLEEVYLNMIGSRGMAVPR